jgi:hypothetical protein
VTEYGGKLVTAAHMEELECLKSHWGQHGHEAHAHAQSHIKRATPCSAHGAASSTIHEYRDSKPEGPGGTFSLKYFLHTHRWVAIYIHPISCIYTAAISCIYTESRGLCTCGGGLTLPTPLLAAGRY